MFGRLGAWPAAGVWIKAMASATAAEVSILYIIDAPLFEMWSLTDPVADRDRVLNDQKIGASG